MRRIPTTSYSITRCVFDNEKLAQIVFFKFKIGEISCPTRYFEEASSINFTRSVRYGLGVLATSLKFRLQKLGLGSFRIFAADGLTLSENLEESTSLNISEPTRRSAAG